MTEGSYIKLQNKHIANVVGADAHGDPQYVFYGRTRGSAPTDVKLILSLQIIIYLLMFRPKYPLYLLQTFVGAGLVPARFSKKSKKSGRAQGPPLHFLYNLKIGLNINR